MATKKENPPMPEDHIALLKSAMKIPEGDHFPKSLEDHYWNVERTCRRIGQQIDGHMIVMIALLYGRPAPKDPVSVLDSNPKLGDMVVAKYRGEWVWGTFVRFKDHNKKVVVELSDDLAEQREFDAFNVRVPTKDEKQLVGV